MFPVLCLRWAQLGVKLLSKVPSCSMLELTWTFMCTTWLQFHLKVTTDFVVFSLRTLFPLLPNSLSVHLLSSGLPWIGHGVTRA